jgi:hypothetical protein
MGSINVAHADFRKDLFLLKLPRSILLSDGSFLVKNLIYILSTIICPAGKRSLRKAYDLPEKQN